MLQSNSAHYKHCADKSAEAQQAERFCSGGTKKEKSTWTSLVPPSRIELLSKV